METYIQSPAELFLKYRRQMCRKWLLKLVLPAIAFISLTGCMKEEKLPAPNTGITKEVAATQPEPAKAEPVVKKLRAAD